MSADSLDAASRLAAYEAFASDVRDDLDQTGERMDALRAQSKVKSATYRQLFAIRSTLREIDRRLAEHGL